MYEAMACSTHGSEEKYRKHWMARPGDIVGRTIRLEPLDVERHLQELYNITNGEAYMENKAYDANEVWCFREAGPFKNAVEMQHSLREEMLMIESELNKNVSKETSLDKDAKISDFDQNGRNETEVSIINCGKEETSGDQGKKSRTKKSFKKLDLTGVQSKYLRYNKQSKPVFKDYLHKSNKPFIGYVSKV